MDISPLLHALCAVAAQILVGLFTGNWAYGAIAGCTFFIAREHTQAEYRWIEMFGHGKRMCQRQDYWPFFAIFNVRYWSLMLSAFRHFIITDWRGVFCQHSR
ncbi:hypothetical protein I0C88_22810, partial [Escherichia coli]